MAAPSIRKKHRHGHKLRPGKDLKRCKQCGEQRFIGDFAWIAADQRADRCRYCWQPEADDD